MNQHAELPALDDDVVVDAAEVTRFERDGFACIRGLATRTEVAAHRPHIVAAALAHAYDKRSLAERGTYGRAFLQSTNLWRRDPRIASFTLARRFARVAARLLGVPAVRLYHDQALFKEPGGGITPWHQDQTYWPLATDRTITLWMPLVDVPEAVGSMHFVPGCWRYRSLGVPGISGTTQRHFDALVAERGWRPHTFGAMQAGDATFHAGWMLHSASANPTPLLREVMTIIYYADGSHVLDAPSETQWHDLRTWLPGCVPGGIAASNINPLLV